MGNKSSIQQLLSNAVAAAKPSCSQMFTNVHECSPKPQSDKTKPLPPSPPFATASKSSGAVVHSSARTAPEHQTRSQMFTDVHECSHNQRNDKTNPTTATQSPLTPRQVAAARLLALGRGGSAVAREVGVDKHTVSRWKRSSAFAKEVKRQHELILVEQVRQRRAESVDAYAAAAERVARKYGLVR